jgi:hypothetical protein
MELSPAGGTAGAWAGYEHVEMVDALLKDAS